MSAAPHQGCDRAIAAAAAATLPAGATASTSATDHPRIVLATTILASSLAFIDGSVVNVGLPAIGRSLNADGGVLSWIINGYLLPLSALLLLGGAAGDRFGRRRILVLGVSLFALASALCALAPSAGLLVAGRIAQGVGAALLMPNSLAILGTHFEGEARGRAIGIWAAVGAAAGAIGPLLGGWLVDVTGWRAIFFINLPLAAAAIFLALRYLRDEQQAAGATLDISGAATASVGLGALTWGLTVATSGAGLHWQSGLAIAAGIVLMLLFLRVEQRAGDSAMLPLSLFRSHSFSGLNLMTFLLYGALGALLLVLPFVLIEYDHYSASAAGAALLPLPVVIALASSTMGRLAGKLGPRLPLTAGPIIVAAGFMLSMRIGGGSYWTTTLPAMLVIAIGMAVAVAPLTTAVLSSVDAGHSGVASGFNSAVARAGGLFTTALLASVLSAQGAALLDAFHVAALACAVTALASAACAWRWIDA
ncbi:MFS transporter [Pseudoduganella sp. FT25W]|uniref:MFS transporter n=1 Tax=Duganella alba TaxID=2666081 RepID=A0A6L5QHD7_9BURK|nr:MFS transporter [Duganella alba]MRX08712.1 MFS transporter [Duganella alba]MRX18274.1 MFS transporter [Duganella alba]